MLVNRYKLTSIISGKVIIGTRRELEKMGFVPDYVNTLTYTGYLYAQEWRCERMDRVEQNRKKTEPKEKKQTLDDIARMAKDAGMHYGDYVALHNL